MLALFIGIVYLLLAAYLGAGLILFHHRRLPIGSPLGIVNEATTADEDAWGRAHRAAWPLLGATAFVCVLNGFTIATLSAQAELFVQLSMVAGTAIFTGIVYWAARRVASVRAKTLKEDANVPKTNL